MAIKPITPRATEKAYVFNAPLTLNKNQIKEAIEKEFEVTVTGVRTVVQAGKVKRINKSRNPKRYVAGSTTQKDIKKAYVTVKEGDKIAIFESAEAETAEEKK